MSLRDFVSVFGEVFEDSVWIAALAWHVGFTAQDDTVPGLLSSFIDVVEEAGREPQLALLRAHPDLAGRLALKGNLTASSRNEQMSAGLDQCTEVEYQAFRELNIRYHNKYQFPFILAVRGRPRSEILKIFRLRLENEVDEEFREALRQVYEIARLRLMQIQ